MRCQATFRIGTTTRSATSITQALGRTPTSSHEIGEAVGRSSAARTQTQWNVSTEMREPSDLADHLTELLNLIEPVLPQVAALRGEGCTIDWFCFVEAAATERAVELLAPLLARLALVGGLLIDTYGTDND